MQRSATFWWDISCVWRNDDWFCLSVSQPRNPSAAVAVPACCCCGRSLLFAAAAAIWVHNDDGLQIRRQWIFIACAVDLRMPHENTDLFNQYLFFATKTFHSDYDCIKWWSWLRLKLLWLISSWDFVVPVDWRHKMRMIACFLFSYVQLYRKPVFYILHIRKSTRSWVSICSVSFLSNVSLREVVSRQTHIAFVYMWIIVRELIAILSSITFYTVESVETAVLLSILNGGGLPSYAAATFYTKIVSIQQNIHNRIVYR